MRAFRNSVRLARFHRPAIALAAVLLAACAAPPLADEDARFEAFVLGVAQDGGVPHLGCDERCCVEARRTGARQGPASLGLHDRATGKLVLLDATPAIEEQVALLHELAGAPPRGRRPVDAILLTHAHVGHYLGLAWLGREIAGAPGVPTWVSPRFAAFLRANGPWSQLVELGQIALQPFAPGVAFAPIDGLRVTAVPVPHRDEFSDTMAFKVEGPRATLLFAPDVDRWSAGGELLAQLLDGVDVAYLDGTFYDGRELPGRDLAEIPHPPMLDTMQRLAGRAAAAPGSIRFIHLNHSNPALHDAALRRALEQRGFRVAARAERVAL